ncbi:GldL-related protein [Niabella ginsengisoli]|uniref:Gliding motility protein GldL-like N-terminal domain-containing protein n=1 Tax=Niabella ginsengisoli TaxID=522298 RepID=A0ABS9SE46_9BACT|nr:hypothetical protein [Niabella ginsengisoli]MCH5596633.1 hypothetical protein [Niabella ginsengisoli]
MSAEKNSNIQRYLNIFFSLGAVPVLLGALFKLTNTAPIGDPDTWLKFGMYTEALVFLIYALMYAFKPEALDDATTVAVIENTSVQKTSRTGSALASMDEMLQAADITPESLNRLSDGFKSLEVNINKISSATNSVVETEEYAKQVKEATLSIHRVNTYYNKLAETSHALINSAEDAKATQKEMADLAKNLAKLNQMYSSMISAMQMKGA